MKNESEEAPVGTPWERLDLREHAGAVRIPVRVRPRASRSAIAGVREGELDVSLTSPPVDGQANAELIRLVARALEVRQADLTIVLGASGRSKVVEVARLTPAEARERLARAAR